MATAKSERRTKILLFGIIGNEVPTLRHLLDQKRDSLHVYFDSLQGFGIFNEREDRAHRGC